MTEAGWLARVALQHDYDVGLDWLHCLSNKNNCIHLYRLFVSQCWTPCVNDDSLNDRGKCQCTKVAGQSGNPLAPAQNPFSLRSVRGTSHYRTSTWGRNCGLLLVSHPYHGAGWRHTHSQIFPQKAKPHGTSNSSTQSDMKSSVC